jgi:hypothetical protein
MAIKCSVSQPFWGPIMPRACVRITGRACVLQWFHAVFRRKLYRLDSGQISSPALLSLLVICVSCSLSLSIALAPHCVTQHHNTPISTLLPSIMKFSFTPRPQTNALPHHPTPPPPFPICPPQYIFALPTFTLHDIYYLICNYSIKSTPKVVGLGSGCGKTPSCANLFKWHRPGSGCFQPDQY